MKKLVIFDLDGTLLDSVYGLECAVNHALTKQGFAMRTTSEIRSFIGNGILNLLQKSLPKEHRNTDTLAKTRDEFLSYYDENALAQTSPFKDIILMLEALQAKRIKLAVASNKYDKATKQMVAHFFANIEFSAVLGQRKDIALKPDPQIIYDAMQLADISDKSQVIYVGDSDVDMLTGANAGVDTIGVCWGLSSLETLISYSPRFIASDVFELISMVSG